MLTLGEETARSLGVDTERVKKQLFALTALLTGAIVSVSGMIGFVGMVVPHAVRLLIGSDHRLLLPASALGRGHVPRCGRYHSENDHGAGRNPGGDRDGAGRWPVLPLSPPLAKRSDAVR